MLLWSYNGNTLNTMDGMAGGWMDGEKCAAVEGSWGGISNIIPTLVGGKMFIKFLL